MVKAPAVDVQSVAVEDEIKPRLFRTRWILELPGDEIAPIWNIRGFWLGRVPVDDETAKPSSEVITFRPSSDILYLETHVFHDSQYIKDVVRIYPDETSPELLNLDNRAVEHIAIGADALVGDQPMNQDANVWDGIVQYVLGTYTNAKTITVLVPTLVNACALPGKHQEGFYYAHIDTVAPDDLERFGLSHPDSFVFQDWEKMTARLAAPELKVKAIVYYGKEWVCLDGEGGLGGPAKLADPSSMPVELTKETVVGAEASQDVPVGVVTKVKEKASRWKMPTFTMPTFGIRGRKETRMTETKTTSTGWGSLRGKLSKTRPMSMAVGETSPGGSSVRAQAARPKSAFGFDFPTMKLPTRSSTVREPRRAGAGEPRPVSQAGARLLAAFRP